MSEFDKDGWSKIGTVVGNAGTAEFTFILKHFEARVGDIVAIPRMHVPDNAYEGKVRIHVWARITEIRRFNPFFPFEAAQEIAGEGIFLEDTVLSDTRDQLEAVALILGATPENDFSRLAPLTYPVKPASSIYRPPANDIRQLLVGGRENEDKVRIGSLIARSEVDVTLSAPRLVARHLAILAMTGGGKTVAARRIIRELIALRYPVLILDPHGDYVGLKKCSSLFEKEGATIKLFYPELIMQKSGESLVKKIIGQMTDDGLKEAQSDLLDSVFKKHPATEGEPTISYVKMLIPSVDSVAENTNKKLSARPLKRKLGIVHAKLDDMRRTNKTILGTPRLRKLDFERLPNPVSQPEEIVRPGQLSILYLGGYDHVTQCSIVSILLETLFEFRANFSGRIAPFLTVVEEAHTFIPSTREGTAVSLPVLRRIITEGRKFGTGLVLISQRPYRLEETLVSQCNSFLILRLVNPRDKNFVRQVMENLTESDARMIPGFGPGQGIVSGQVVRFPLPVRVKMDEELRDSEIGDENFLEEATNWATDNRASSKKATGASTAATKKSSRKRNTISKSKYDKRGRQSKLKR